MERVLLLVDDEENILRSLRRTFHRAGYKILIANSGEEGLKLLEKNEVGVIVSDQRMPGMTGSEFLRRAREKFPEAIRIMLSGYTELSSVTKAINQGSIYKFLTKPWEDELLLANIKDAFEHYELRRENARLARELSDINQRLEQRVKERTREAMLSMRSLQVAHDVLEALPLGVIGVDCNGTIVSANQFSHRLLDKQALGLVGRQAKQALPPVIHSLLQDKDMSEQPATMLEAAGQSMEIACNRLKYGPEVRGHVLVCTPIREQ